MRRRNVNNAILRDKTTSGAHPGLIFYTEISCRRPSWAGGFLNALGPNCSRRQKGQEAGAAAGARAANIVTDGQLLLFNFSLFFSRGISLRPDELSWAQTMSFTSSNMASKYKSRFDSWRATISEPAINVSCSRQPFPGTAPHRHRSRWPSDYTCDYPPPTLRAFLSIYSDRNCFWKFESKNKIRITVRCGREEQTWRVGS